MSADDAEVTVNVLAEQLGVAIRPEHLAEAARAWRLMAPHLRRVTEVELGSGIEPASLFRP